MATKKMKKFKRYEEGGEVTVDEPKTRRISFNPDGSRTQSFAEQIASRQQTGGDQAAFKKSGLEASNKEKPVGFFERLRMGNIDEVGTEAYNRLGAGRGRTSAPVPAINQVAPRKVSIGDEAYENERAKKRAMARSREMQQDISAGTDFVNRPQDEGYRPYISPRDRAMAEGEKDAGKIIENTGPRTKPVAEKPRVVSKKELEDSGFDNLRDYLNDQKGLSRKSSDKHAEARKNLSSGKKRIDEGGKPYRSGGSVSSASSRADGIATKGKTRGKMR